MQEILEKKYLEIVEDLDALFLYEPVLELVKTNEQFKIYLAKDLVITYDYEKKINKNDNFPRLLLIVNNLWSTSISTEEFIEKFQIDDYDTQNNHKILKQQLYKNLFLTVADIKTNLSKANQQAVRDAINEQPEENLRLIDDESEVSTNDNPSVKVALETNSISKKQQKEKKQNKFFDFFKKPNDAVLNAQTFDEIRRLSLADKFLHAKRTQAWFKEATKQLLWIYCLPFNKKKRIELTKANFVRHFNETYGTHYQVANLNSDFYNAYMLYVDGKSFKNSVRVWLVAVVLPIFIIIIVLSIVLPKINNN